MITTRERITYGEWPKTKQPKRRTMAAPSKTRLTEHNDRTVCANPQGVPAKWLPIYLELASRLQSGGPSFAIGKDENERGMPVTLRLKDECGSWSTIGDPADAAKALYMDAPTKPAPTPRKVTAPKSRAQRTNERQDKIMKRVAELAAVQPTQAPKAQKPALPSSSLPQWAEEWLAGLVFETKRDYARQFLAHLLCDAPAPECPGTEWAEKARKRARRLADLAA